MRKCKVKGCDEKRKGRGYCQLHYKRKFEYKLPFTLRCKWCNEKLPKKKWRFCNDKCTVNFWYHKKGGKKWKKEYVKGKYVRIYIAGRSFNVFTNGVTEEIKPLIPEIKNKVLEDCISNPSKYLMEVKPRKKLQRGGL